MTENPLDILNALREDYGPLTPTERENMEAQWSAPWNTSVPIESYFAMLEDIYEMAVANPPAYTQDQMI